MLRRRGLNHGGGVVMRRNAGSRRRSSITLRDGAASSTDWKTPWLAGGQKSLLHVAARLHHSRQHSSRQNAATTTRHFRCARCTCREDRLSLALARPVCPRDHSQRPNLSVQARFRVRLGYYPRRAHYYSLAAATCSSRLTLTLRFPAGKLKSPLPFPRPDGPNHTRFYPKRRDQIMLAPTAPPYP